jgi:hypothetical protein
VARVLIERAEALEAAADRLEQETRSRTTLP